MLLKVFIGLFLMAVRVTIHASGLAWGLHRIKHQGTELLSSRMGIALMLIKVAAWSIRLHLMQIAVRAYFYLWQNGMPDLPSALYFMRPKTPSRPSPAAH